MRKFGLVLAVAVATATAFPALGAEGEPQAIAAQTGQMVYTPAGRPLLPIYKVSAAGELQVIVDSRVVTLPVASLSMSGRKLTTSLSLADLRRRARP